MLYVVDLFGFQPRLELSTRPEKRVGTEEMWDKAEAALERALISKGLHPALSSLSTFGSIMGDGCALVKRPLVSL